MSRLYGYLSGLVAFTLFLTSCNGNAVQAAPSVLEYGNLLGQSLDDREFMDMLTARNCTHTTQFLLCQEEGIALWHDSDRLVEKVYLYLNNSAGFKAYKGSLPFGLKYYDTLGAVEYKLNRQGVGKNGLPDEAVVPDHMHYWAFYKEQSVTILYNYPFADEDATIYAVLVTE